MTTPAVRIGALLPTREMAILDDFSIAPLLDFARRAESLGYDSLWTGDSLTARTRLDPFVVLSAVSSITSTISLGTGALTASLRHPLLGANMVSSLDHASGGGRLMLGLGAGSLARFCAKHTRVPVLAVEWNPRVTAACHMFFRLPGANRLQVEHADAGAWVADPLNAGRCPVLMVDLYDAAAEGPVRDSVKFYRDCRRVLGEVGILAVNLFGRHESFGKNIDNLSDGAWTAGPVKQAAEMWAEVGAKYMNKAHEGLIHTEVQLQQNQNKVAIYPSGSWLEAEQAKSTPAGFNYAVMPIPGATASDSLPAAGLYAAAGEP